VPRVSTATSSRFTTVACGKRVIFTWKQEFEISFLVFESSTYVQHGCRRSQNELEPACEMGLNLDEASDMDVIGESRSRSLCVGGIAQRDDRCRGGS